MCYTKLILKSCQIAAAPSHLIYPGAYGVAMAALPQFVSGQTVTAQQLDAVYLRKPQAVQMREKRLAGEEDTQNDNCNWK